MAESPQPEKLVYISGHPTPALEEPRFIVKVGDKYYVTFGAWEYDPHTSKVKLSHEQLEDIRKLAHAFDAGPHYSATIASPEVAFSASHTGPAPTPGPGPIGPGG